ncbi:MAG: hypothetical protein VKI63_06165 [Cyanobium sp.]|nr:hypothetical protein [Cyanobium sp.]
MASYANDYGTSTTSLNTLAGMLQAQGQQGNIDIANRFRNNKSIQGLVVGGMIDANTTAQKTASAMMYNKAFMEDTFRHNMAMADADVGRASTLMGIQGNIDKEMSAVEGDQLRRTVAEQGSQNRQLTVAQGEQERQNIAARGDQDVRAIGATGDQNVRAIGAKGDQDVRAIAAKGDQDVRTIGATGDQNVRAIITQGEQSRLGQDRDRDNTIALREDARRQIARQGARFYA